MCVERCNVSVPLYFQAMSYAELFLKKGRYNVEAGDVVHDLIVEKKISHCCYQDEIRNSILRQSKKKVWEQPVVQPDFTCTVCKVPKPAALQRKWKNKDGVFERRNTCLDCCRKNKQRWQELSGYNAREEVKQKKRAYDLVNREAINKRKRELYHQNKKQTNHVKEPTNINFPDRRTDGYG